MKLNLQKIQAEMERQGMNGKALSDKMGVKHQFIYQVFKGRAGRTFRTAERLAKALGIPDPKDLIQS